MRSKIQKWGNSLALRIPKSFAEEAHVAEGSDVRVQLRNGGIVVLPLTPRPTLRSLLARVTAENVHREIDTGYVQGSEIW